MGAAGRVGLQEETVNHVSDVSSLEMPVGHSGGVCWADAEEVIVDVTTV